MQVLEAGQVAAHDDQVHAALVLDVVVAHGLAALVEHAEGELLLTAALQLGRADVELEPGVGDRETVHVGGACVIPARLLGAAVGVAGHRLGGLLVPGVRVERAAGGGRGGEEHGEERAEEDEPRRRAHATTS